MARAGDGALGRREGDVAVSMVNNAIYIDGKRAVRPASLDQTVDELRRCPDAEHTFCWIGLLHPSDDEIRAVAKEFNLHPLAVEDAIDAHQRPKLERYDNTLFVVLRPARYVDPVEVVELGEVHLFIGPDFVVALRHAEQPDLAEVRNRLEETPDLLRLGPYAVLYAVEGIGLWINARWAQYLTAISTSLFIPLELWQLGVHFTPMKLLALAINVAIVVYLVWLLRAELAAEQHTPAKQNPKAAQS